MSWREVERRRWPACLRRAFEVWRGTNGLWLAGYMSDQGVRLWSLRDAACHELAVHCDFREMDGTTAPIVWAQKVWGSTNQPTSGSPG